MRHDDYNHAINAVICGYVLVIAALVLNAVAGNKFGAAFAVLSMAVAYFHESVRAAGITANWMSLISAVLCATSYVMWLSN